MLKRFTGLSAAAAVAVLSMSLSACNDDENAETNDFVISLSGANEVPPVDTPATGTATIDVDEDSMTVSISVKTSGISPNPTAAHLHDNFAGGNGPVIFGLTQNEDLNNFSGSTTLTSEQLQKLYNGGLYINVHSANVPSGELRGQALGGDVSVISFAIEGAQENPAVTTEHSGNVSITVVGDEAVEVRGDHDVNDSTMAHIHTGAVGVNGPVLLGLGQTSASDSARGTISQSITGEDLSEALTNGLQNGGLYVNLHSTTVPSGELRGQIVDGGITVDEPETTASN